MARYLLKAPDESFDRWRAAAGSQPLAGWIRARLDEAAASTGVAGSVAYPPESWGVAPVVDQLVRGGRAPEHRREFKPDFGKRLKP